jgi:hypothetical protein
MILRYNWIIIYAERVFYSKIIAYREVMKWLTGI